MRNYQGWRPALYMLILRNQTQVICLYSVSGKPTSRVFARGENDSQYYQYQINVKPCRLCASNHVVFLHIHMTRSEIRLERLRSNMTV